ncbi:hypothetical protein, partial [Pseudomonas sp. CGJS7]|uniref:hypothetical protein n=1 Tax=Pseudomonas sp. CGJS7 TaxID=3109348 RepID=UPI00300893B3
MKTLVLSCAGLLAFAIAPMSHAQSYSKKAELELAATGESFSVGETRFRLAPSASVRPSAESADPERDVVVAGYLLEPAAITASTGGRAKRSLDAAPASAATGAENLAVAVSEGGLPTVVAPELNVYFDHIGVLDALVRDTGGHLLYSSAIGGKATIGYASVADAIAAMKRIQGRAGVAEVSPRIIE